MNTDHLTDNEIQQYSFDPTNCETSIIKHIELCDTCKAKAGAYQAISSEIKSIQRSVFDFDMAALVLSKLPQPRSKPSFAVYLGYFFSVGLVSLVCISLFLMQPYMTKLFNNIPPLFYYLVAASAITITAFRGIEMYKDFKNKMTRLNLY